MSSIVLTALLIAVPPTPSAPAPASPAVASLTDGHVRAQVLAYLATIDTPIPAAAWAALGARAETVLLDVVQDPATLPTRKAKAVDGLAAVHSAAALPALRTAARAGTEPLVVRFAALRGLGQIADPGAVFTELRPLLEGAEDSRVRAVAGEVLARRGSATACDAVRAQLGREEEDKRPQFDRALAVCAGR